jgi:hypothetical protein
MVVLVALTFAGAASDLILYRSLLAGVGDATAGRVRTIVDALHSSVPTGWRERRETSGLLGMSGHPCIDLGPDLFEPGSQLIRRWNTSGWDHNGADEQLPVNG